MSYSMSNSRNTFSEVEKQQITQFKEVTWTVANFGATDNTGPRRYTYAEVESPSVRVNGLHFFFRLYPFGSKEDLPGDVSLIVYFQCAGFFAAHEHREEVKVRCKIGVINDAGERVLIQDRIKPFKRNLSKTKRNRRDDRYVLANRDRLLDPHNRLLHDTDLVIFCELEVVDDELNPTRVEPVRPTLPSQSVNTKLERLRTVKPQTNEHSVEEHSIQKGDWHCANLVDSELKLGNTTFKVHRAVLAAQSPKLVDIMDRIQDVSDEFAWLQSDVIEQVLRFIYTDKVQRASLEQMADKLLIVCHELDLPKLKAKCQEQLCERLTRLNVSSTNVVDNFNSNLSKVLDADSLKTVKVDKPELFAELLAQITKMIRNV